MKTLSILSFLLLFTVPMRVWGQDEESSDEEEETVAEGFSLPTPSAGKALVIFTRPVLDAPVVKFKYFCNDKYLGKMGIGSYLVYECDPGRYLFWADSERIQVMKAEVAADRVYIFDTFVQTGMLRSILTLKPFDPESKRADNVRQRLIGRISKKAEQRFDPEHGEKPSKKLQRTAQRVMENYTVEPSEDDDKFLSDVKHMAASQYLQ